MNYKIMFSVVIICSTIFGVSATQDNKDSSEYPTFTISTLSPNNDKEMALKVLDKLGVGEKLIIQKSAAIKKYTVKEIDWQIIKESDLLQPEYFELGQSNGYIRGHIESIIQQGEYYRLNFKLDENPNICLSGHDKVNGKSYYETVFLQYEE